MSRWFALIYDFMSRREPAAITDQRRTLLADLDGEVLEVGAGNGLNFAHYPAAVRLTAIDRNPHLLRRAEPRAADAPAVILLRRMEAPPLPFPDGTFDHTVITLVLCSVKDPAAVLAEMRRVTRPGGTIRLLEHVRADGRWTARIQHGLSPVWRHLSDGCRLDRATLPLLQASGLALERVASVAGTPRLIPMIAVVARVP